MGCTSDCMKCILNILNILLGLFGIALIAVATLSLKSAPSAFIYYLYIIGAVNLIASLMGCCGICQEDVCLTTTYALIILLSLVAQIFGKFYAVNSEGIRKFATEDVEKTWMQEIRSPGAMNNTQQTYQCCGKNEPNDYINILKRASYPLSCYPNERYNVTALYRKGCIDAAQDAFINIFNYSSSGEWSNLVITAIMFVFAAYLAIRFRRKQNRYSY